MCTPAMPVATNVKNVGMGSSGGGGATRCKPFGKQNSVTPVGNGVSGNSSPIGYRLSTVPPKRFWNGQGSCGREGVP